MNAQKTKLSVKHLDHLNMSVNSLRESIDWYGRVLDFEQVQEGVTQDGTPWAIIRSGDAMLCLYEHPELALAESHCSEGRHGLNHFGLRILDRKAWEERIKRENVKLNYGPVHWPHSRAYYVLDPTGYEIEVVVWNDDTIRFPYAR